MGAYSCLRAVIPEVLTSEDFVSHLPGRLTLVFLCGMVMLTPDGRNSMTDEEAKAIQEVAKVAGKGLDTVSALGGFVAMILQDSLVNSMGLVSDKLAYMRGVRQLRYIKKTQELMSELGLKFPTRSVPMNFAIPILQAASMEEDDALQDIWAQLLTNALDADSGVEIRRSFISILENLTPFEVDLLDRLYKVSLSDRGAISYTHRLPETLVLYPDENVGKDLTYDEKTQVALWNLARLGCVNDVSAFGPARNLTLISLTPLGEAFVSACTLKPKG